MSEVPEVINGPGWVIMEHPTLPGQYAEVTEAALAQSWAPQGWRKIEPPTAPAAVAGAPGPPPPPAARQAAPEAAKTSKVSA